MKTKLTTNKYNIIYHIFTINTFNIARLNIKQTQTQRK